MPFDDTTHPPTIAHTKIQTVADLNEKELTQCMEDKQARNIVLLGLPYEIYAIVDSYTTVHDMLVVIERQMQCTEVGIEDKQTNIIEVYENFTSVP